MKKKHLLKYLERLYIPGLGQLVGWSVGRSVGRLQCWAETNVSLAFEDAQVIPPFSREETDDTDNTDDTEDTDDTDRLE